MNKRQRKKQIIMYRKQEVKLMEGLCDLLPFNYSLCKQRLLLIPHRRRHWLSPTEYKRQRDELLAEIEAEKAFMREKSRTHRYTLGGWVKKDSSKPGIVPAGGVTMAKYVQMSSNGILHIKREGMKRTVCGRNYAHLDYLPVSEDEITPYSPGICYKCQNKRREGPRTIKEAFTPANIYEKR